MTLLERIKKLDRQLTRTTDRVRRDWWKYLEYMEHKGNPLQENSIPVNPRDNTPRTLSQEDIYELLGIADEREEDKLWMSIHSYVNGGLRVHSVTRATLLERELRWMRDKAFQDGLTWGKPDA